jgi:hypothetical protein
MCVRVRVRVRVRVAYDTFTVALSLIPVMITGKVNVAYMLGQWKHSTRNDKVPNLYSSPRIKMVRSR